MVVPASATRFEIGCVSYAVLALPSDVWRDRWRLTPTEIALSSALCAGRSNALIAKQRRRSIHTVRNQLAALYRKLGVTSRRAAMARLLAP